MNTVDTTEKYEDICLVFKKARFDTLNDGISQLQENVLRRMAAHWIGSENAMIQPLEDLRGMLRRAMEKPSSIGLILDRLPKRSYDLLFFVQSESGFLTMEELRSGFPMEETEALGDLLTPLKDRGLIWECRQSARAQATARLFILSTCAEYLQLPSYLEGKYGSLLPRRSKEQLYNLIRALDGDVKSLARSHQVIPWLKSQLLNPSRLRRFVDSLELSDRKLLKILAIHPNGLLPEELLYEYSLFSTDGHEESLRQSLLKLKDDFGLIDIKVQTEAIGKRQIKHFLYRLPTEMAHIIRHSFKDKYSDSLPTIPVFKPPDEDFALESRGKERPTLWIDFQQLLTHLIRCEVGVIRKGGMHKKNLKRILDRLEGRPVDAYHYLDFLFLYAYERDIVYPDRERWKIRVDNIQPIQNVAAFYRDFWTFYRNNASWNDRDSSPLQGVLQKGDSTQVFALRRSILRMLWDCPVGQWIETKVFFDLLCDREMAFRIGELPFVSSDPLREKYRLTKSNLERSLSWIGLVDTTTITNQRNDLFRLTEIGAWLIGSDRKLVPFVQKDEPSLLSIQANLEIMVPGNFLLEKQLYLARFTDDQKGRILLNRASIRRGLAEGITIQKMQDFLEEHSQTSLSANALHLLDEVNEKAAHVLVGGEPARLEVSNQNLLDELLLQERLHPFIGERDSDKRALIRRGTDLAKLMEELRKAGYTPRNL